MIPSPSFIFSALTCCRRGYGRASRGDNAGGDEEALIGVVQELNASIADISRTNIEMGCAAKIRRVDNLREQCYQVALQKATANSVEEKQPGVHGLSPSRD